MVSNRGNVATMSADKPKRVAAGRLFRRRVRLEDVVPDFQKAIDRQEDILFGLALFFEGWSVLRGDNPAAVQSSRMQFRRIIDRSREVADQARALLARVQEGAARPGELSAFAFSPCEGHAQPEAMARRAECLAQSYQRLFPGRARGEPFTQGEILRLMEEAAASLKEDEPEAATPAPAVRR